VPHFPGTSLSELLERHLSPGALTDDLFPPPPRAEGFGFGDRLQHRIALGDLGPKRVH
jgi:hypothetical protein